MTALLLVVVAVLQSITLQWYALTPGSATPLSRSMTISGAAQDKPNNSISMVDVWVQQLTAWEWLTMHLRSHVEFLPASWMVDPGVPASELDHQGYIDMDISKQQAAVAALRQIGWTVPRHPRGVQAYSVVVPSPAHRAHLGVGDVVTSVDGARVTSTCQLISSVAKAPVGSTLTFHVEKAHYSHAGAVTWPQSANVTVRTIARPAHSAPSGCSDVTKADRSWIGLSVQNVYSYAMPVTISVKTDQVGGPSSGLAMTLTALDRLTKGSLTGGLKIAATGTMDENGNVGEIGGLAEKAPAVAASGATVFYVPASQVKEARANAPTSLRIVGVKTLAQVLTDLRAHGGDRPVPLTAPR